MIYWGRQAAGILVIAADTRRFLLLKRSGWVNEPYTWGIPGGAIDRGETPRQGALREAREELGRVAIAVSKDPLYVWRAPDSDFAYSTFVGKVAKEFEPNMENGEHEDYKWVSLPEWLKHEDLHFGVVDLLRLAMPAIVDLLAGA